MSAQQTGAPTGFHIMMPPGWARYTVDDAGKRALIARISERMKALGRPDLDAQSRTLVEGQWRQLLATKASAVYLPGEREDDVVTPMTIAVRQFSAPAGRDFETAVRALARVAVDRIEGPYGPILRWTNAQNGTGELAEVRSRLIGYAFPLPAASDSSSSSRGLVFLTSIPHLSDTDAEMVDGLTELSDTILETFRWR